jgi:NADPH-dependent 2,4-dienoyl-CoA reductase/sulfur reductase-like enzyme
MRVLVIGGNAAGMSAASRLVRRSRDVDVHVFERTRVVSYGACGLPYFIAGLNPDLNLIKIRPVEEFEKTGIKVHLGYNVVAVNPRKRTITVCDSATGTNRDESYDKLVVATGAAPFIPPIPGAALEGVFTLKTLSDAENIKTALLHPGVKNVVIIGGGYIGLELVEACVLQKKQVRLFEALPLLLNGFDEEFGKAVQNELAGHSVAVHTGTAVTEILGDRRVRQVVCGGTVYNADLAIIAIGTRPNTAFLDGALFQKEKNGALTTDAAMQTSVPDVYAAGDCATVMHKILKRPVYIPQGTNANKQGRLVADVILGQQTGFENALGTSMIRCLDLELAKTGVTAREAKAASMQAETVTIQSNSHARYYPDPVPLTIKLCYDPATRVVLGAQLMGRKECAWRVDVFACAVDRGMRAEELGFLDLGYSPPFSSVWDAIHIAANAIK